MDGSFLKMDVFFFVTTIVVLVVGILFAIFMYYLIRVVRDVSEITARVKVEAHDIVEDVRDMREGIKEGISSARTYTKAIAGASIVRGVSNLMEAFVEAQVKRTPNRKRAPQKKPTREDS
ncbi:MAG: hypothetical protein KBD24_01950 [Candidatus Pacebacteria bacterium]|nr:hypothetical protein [Candidatus Paceibacterota bacterium]